MPQTATSTASRTAGSTTQIQASGGAARSGLEAFVQYSARYFVGIGHIGAFAHLLPQLRDPFRVFRFSPVGRCDAPAGTVRAVESRGLSGPRHRKPRGSVASS